MEHQGYPGAAAAEPCYMGGKSATDPERHGHVF